MPAGVRQPLFLVIGEGVRPCLDPPETVQQYFQLLIKM